MFPATSRAVWCLGIGIIALVWLAPTTALGKGLRVGFDFPHAVECRDVTSQEFARQYPMEKTVEGVFRVSARIVEGREQDLDELVVEIRSHSERMRVAEYSPVTTLESVLVGEIETKETSETIGSRGISIGASVPVPYGNLTSHGSPSADLGRTRRTTRTQTSLAPPPSRVIVSSGTTHTEHGVFFKMRSSRESALEDVHKFKVRFVVPRQWRGDWVQLTCRAKSNENGFSLANAKPEAASVYLGLHLAGDVEAQQAAHRLAHAQIRFFESDDRSVARRVASTFNHFVERTQADFSVWLARIGLAASSDASPAPDNKGQKRDSGSPLVELRAARDAMARLGADTRSNCD